MAKSQSTQQSGESGWDRAYREIERSREENRRPDPSQFKDLTKAVGSNK